jgi:hypothetical protein
MRALEEHLRAQLDLLQACRRRAVDARDPRLCSAWIASVVQLCHAMAAVGSLVADLKWAPDSTAECAFPLASRLPRLPLLRAEEGTPLPPQIRKTTSGRSARFTSNLAPLSSPACGGGGSPRSGETVGGAVHVPPSAARRSARSAPPPQAGEDSQGKGERRGTARQLQCPEIGLPYGRSPRIPSRPRSLRPDPEDPDGIGSRRNTAAPATHRLQGDPCRALLRAHAPGAAIA